MAGSGSLDGVGGFVRGKLRKRFNRSASAGFTIALVSAISWLKLSGTKEPPVAAATAPPNWAAPTAPRATTCTGKPTSARRPKASMPAASSPAPVTITAQRKPRLHRRSTSSAVWPQRSVPLRMARFQRLIKGSASSGQCLLISLASPSSPQSRTSTSNPCNARVNKRRERRPKASRRHGSMRSRKCWLKASQSASSQVQTERDAMLNGACMSKDVSRQSKTSVGGPSPTASAPVAMTGLAIAAPSLPLSSASLPSCMFSMGSGASASSTVAAACKCVCSPPAHSSCARSHVRCSSCFAASSPHFGNSSCEMRFASTQQASGGHNSA
mmetsp:Transcript_76272/g.168926  ORF Transcript_76272/g.168926 Transcript_76272/m.168926 type:complete len:327 (+) Transcript_76272:994-1974(+)